MAGFILLLGTGCPLFQRDEPVGALSNPLSRAFSGRLTYAAGEGAYVVLSGDLNRDGLADIVSVDWSAETVSVLTATGAGYSAPESYAVGATPRGAALADLSGNGVLDIAVVHESQSQVTVLFGDGSGGFDQSSVIQLPNGAGPRDIIAHDLNGNGKMDLAAAGTAGAAVIIIPGKGNGEFGAPAALPIGHAPWSLWAGDVSGNGIPDIVTANPDTNTLALLEGLGDSYLSPRYIPCGDGPTWVRGADLNRNGVIDLLAGNAGSGDIAVLRGLGAAMFAEETRVAFPYVAGRFVVADLNGNTLPDIAVVLFDRTGDDRRPTSLFAVAHGDGTGNFRAPVLYGAGWGALDIAAADLNNNGRLDLVTADYYTDTVSVVHNRGGGLFESDRRLPVAAGIRKALAADFTQNGRLDVAVMNTARHTVTVLENRGAGAFEALPPIALPAQPLAMAAGDINGNGKQDLVVSLSNQRRLFLYLAAGGGQFLPAASVPVLADESGALPEVRSLALGDMNGNGRLDIVTGNAAANSVSVLLNTGNGAFQAPVTTQVGNYPRDVHVTDLNGDGVLDLVFLSTRNPNVPNDNTEPRVVRWFGTGDGGFDFKTHARFATGRGPVALTMADVNGSGRRDAITVHPEDNSVHLLAGARNGDFGRATRLHVGENPIGVVAADINRNGRADLLTPLAGGSIVLRYSRGDMKFEGPNNFTLFPDIAHSLAADLDNNGHPDVVNIHTTSGHIGILYGRTP